MNLSGQHFRAAEVGLLETSAATAQALATLKRVMSELPPEMLLPHGTKVESPEEYAVAVVQMVEQAADALNEFRSALEGHSIFYYCAALLGEVLERVNETRRGLIRQTAGSMWEALTEKAKEAKES